VEEGFWATAPQAQSGPLPIARARPTAGWVRMPLFNVEYRLGYAHEASMKALHDIVAAFILKTENSKTE